MHARFSKRTIVWSIIWLLSLIASSFIIVIFQDTKYVYGIVLFYLGILVVFQSYLDLYRIFKTVFWLKQPAEIENTFVKEFYERGRYSDTFLLFTPIITYKYEFNGSFYLGERFSVFENDFAFFEKDDAQKIIDTILASPLYVKVNPNKPNEAFILYGFTQSRIINIVGYSLIALIFVFLGFLFLNAFSI